MNRTRRRVARRVDPEKAGSMLLRIERTIRSIPRGKVSTYGGVARAAGYPGAARQVAKVLRRSFGLPWQRVLGAGGAIKLQGDSAIEQRLRLEAEGVRFRGRKVDMKQCEWIPRRVLSCLFAFLLMLTYGRLALCAEIHDAVKNNDVARVKKLIKERPDLVFDKDEDGFTPLHLAAANGYTEIAEFLLANKAQVSVKDNNGSMPLHQAAAARDHRGDLVEVLLAHKADVNATDKNGMIPLHYAALADNTESAKCLLTHGADANVKDSVHGDTPLILAAGEGHKEVAELLLEHGADVSATDKNGMAALHHAALANAKEIVELLLAHNANVNAKDIMGGDTPLIYAAGEGYKDVVELLLSHGADVNATDKEMRTPLAWAEHNRHSDVADLLRKHDAHE